MRLPWRRGDRGSSLDLLVVGLGNPGREYAHNRHNVGWLVVDELARRHGGNWRGKFSGQLAEIRIEGHKVALLKPEALVARAADAVETLDAEGLGRRSARSTSAADGRSASPAHASAPRLRHVLG